MSAQPVAATLVTAPASDDDDLRLVRDAVALMWADVLGDEPADDTVTFFEAGGTSLQAIDLATRLHDAFGVEIDLAELFAGGSVAALSRDILARAIGEDA